MTSRKIFSLAAITLFVVLCGNYLTGRFSYEAGAQERTTATIQTKKLALSNLPQPQLTFPSVLGKKPPIYARSYILLDGETKYTYAEKDADNPVPVASITKLMTYLTAHDLYKNDEVVTISRSAAAVTGSELQLLTGETMSVESLYQALLLNSANDAAHALAEHSGSLETFVDQMNKKAKALGLHNTHFQDPAGLNDTGYSTPRDIALLLNYLLDDNQFKSIIRTAKKTISSSDGRYNHELTNSNRLVNPEESLYYPLALGGKTGFTFEAGHSLATAAQSETGKRMVAVVLHTTEESKEASAREVRKLLVWGMEQQQP